MYVKVLPQSRVFYPTHEWKRAFISILLIATSLWSFPIIFIVEFALWTINRFGPIVNVLVGIGLYFAYLSICFFVFYLFKKPIRHIITSEGITFCSPVYRIYTPWNNIRAVGKSRLGIYRPQALLLQKPAVKGTVRDGSQLERATIEPRRWLTTKKDPPDDAIPLLFTVPANWQESELGLSIKHYAPQIFSNQA